MNKVWHYFQWFLIFNLLSSILLKFIDENLLLVTEEMERTKRENDLPNLEEEYQQLFWLKFLHLFLFNYVDNHLIRRSELIEESQKESNLYQLPYNETVDIYPAICSQKIPSPLKAKEGRFNFTVPFTAIVKNVELWGRDGIAFTEDRKIILEISLDRVDCLKYSVLATLKQGFNREYIRPISNVDYLDSACSLVNYWSHLYAHWIYECLTRLEALEYYSQKTDKKPILIIDKNPPAWKICSLELMGYGLEDCLQWNGYRARVNELVICSKRREEGRTSVKACYWVKERILSNIDSYTSSNLILNSNIFISRKKAKARRIINEEEVINNLTKLDFSTYVLEDIDWQDQVKIFAQAKFIIAPHGGGVTNIIFSKKLNLIELFGNKVSHFYYAIAQGLGFNYGCLFCEARNEDIIVNCQELTKMICRMRA